MSYHYYLTNVLAFLQKGMLRHQKSEKLIPNKHKIYTVSLEDTRKIDAIDSKYEIAISYHHNHHHHRRLSNKSESPKLELNNFLKDFTFSDDILNRRREWL